MRALRLARRRLECGAFVDHGWPPPPAPAAVACAGARAREEAQALECVRFVRSLA